MRVFVYSTRCGRIFDLLFFCSSRLSVYVDWLNSKPFRSSEFCHSHFGMHEHASSRRRECEALAWFLTRSNNGHATANGRGKKIVDDDEETKLFRLRCALCIARRTSHSVWNELRWLWLRVSVLRSLYAWHTYTHMSEIASRTKWVRARKRERKTTDRQKMKKIVLLSSSTSLVFVVAFGGAESHSDAALLQIEKWIYSPAHFIESLFCPE